MGGLLFMYAMTTWAGEHPLRLCLTFAEIPQTTTPDQ